MSARKTASTVFSKMEASFLASSTLRRNKRYLDIEKINQEEEVEKEKKVTFPANLLALFLYWSSCTIFYSNRFHFACLHDFLFA